MSAAADRQATVQHLLHCGGFVLFLRNSIGFVVLRRVAAILWLLLCLGVACGVRALLISSGRSLASAAFCALLARDSCGVSGAKCILLSSRAIFPWGCAALCGYSSPLRPVERSSRYPSPSSNCVLPSVFSHPYFAAGCVLGTLAPRPAPFLCFFTRLGDVP